MKISKKMLEETAAATRLFWEKGLSTGRDSGDLSIMDPDTGLVYIDPRPNETFAIPNWGVIKAEDIIVMDVDGNIVHANNGKEPTVEAPMHLYIYRARPDIKAIVHPHGIYSTAFAAARRDIPMVVYEFNFAGGDVPCAKYAKAGTEELAANIIEVLGDKRKAALMANHGSVALGTDITDAFNVAEYLEKMAQVALYASMLGNLQGVEI
jgi:L-fuculose-phosphate aldolase